MSEKDKRKFKTPKRPSFPEGVVSREKRILEIIQNIEGPLLTALQQEYGTEVRSILCGPAAVALSRILSILTHVPIGLNLKGEHIEIVMGIYDPIDQPNRLDMIEEQTFIKYHVGDGNIYYIDPTYGLLIDKKEDVSGAILVEKYPVEQIDTELISRHSLYPFDPNHEGIEKMFPNRNPDDRLRSWKDFTTIFNDERATFQLSIADSGTIIGSECYRTVPIIQRFAPKFSEHEGHKWAHQSTAMDILAGNI